MKGKADAQAMTVSKAASAKKALQAKELGAKE